MDLTEQFPDLSSFLLYSDGLKPIFFIIANALSNGPPKLSEAALEALEKVREIHAKGARSSDSKYVEVLTPVLLEAMESENIDDQSNALWALAILVKHDQFPGTPPNVTKFLTTANEDILYKTVSVVQKYAHKQVDITVYIPLIEPLLSHSDYWIRRMVADVISEHEIRTGREERISVIEGLREHERLDSYWEVFTYHRRLHAASDKPIILPDNVVHFTSERMCGACGFTKARCIFYWDDSGTGWIDRTSEYHCPVCHKYTEYHYVD